MKKLFLTCIVLLGAFSLFAQTQLSKWLVEGQEINFLTPTPTASPYSATSATVYGNNCVYDNAGNLLFYIYNHAIYNKYSTMVSWLGSCSLASEFGVVPSPENVQNPCVQKYFILINQCAPLVGYLNYGIYDANANGGNGQFTMMSTNLHQMGTPYISMAISKVNASGFRYLYLPTNMGKLRVMKIGATGITGVGIYNSYGASFSAMELSNNGDKLACAGGSTVGIINLTAGLPTGASSFATPGGGTIKDLEFDNTGNYLFYSEDGNFGAGNGVYVKNLTSAGAPTFIPGTASYTGMLEKSYNGTQIICGSATQVSGINPVTATLNPWSLPFNGLFMPDQIDGENYTPKLLSVSGPNVLCIGQNAWINVQVPASMVGTGYMIDVKDMNTNTVLSNATSVSQNFLFTPGVSTQYQVRLYHPSNPSCVITRYWRVYVFVCGKIRIRVTDIPPSAGRFSPTGESENPALETSQGVQTSWKVQEMDPETNEPLATIDNPSCWQLPVSQTLTFKGFNADLDYAGNPGLFYCTSASLDGSFDLKKNYMITRTSWINPANTEVSAGFITAGVPYNPMLSKTSTGVYEETVSGEHKFTLYPNPSKGQISIKANAQQAESIEIYNIAGMKVADISSKNGNLSTVDISSLPNGIYTIKVYSGSDVDVQKIVLER